MSDFVKPQAERLPLSGGKFVDVQKRLNHGDREDMLARMSPYVVPGQAFQLERREVRTAKVLAYLLGWSLVGEDGQPVPYTPDMPESARLDTIRSLQPDRFAEIYELIDKHEDKGDAERAALKNAPAGETASPAI